jgi:DNA primase
MDAKDDIKRRLSVEDVVGSYVELKRAGRNFKALSPFGNERTPSFMVSPEKQIWHDFSANKGGDIFTFVMEMEGVDFVGALEILARKAGLDLSQYQKGSGQTAKLKKRLAEANELAAKYYHASLAKNKKALNYLRKDREFDNKIIQDFKLGYSPTVGRALMQFLLKRKFTQTELKQAGLAVSRSQGWGDMFRGRIMVPLMDGQGQVVGFTARLLGDDPQAPKYINTPQTLLYDKGRHIFGLHLAKQAIREQGFSVVVEGNMDVVASHQAGVSNVVATAGTAVTRDHLVQLSRLSKNVKLAFDQDEAGLVATERAVLLAHEAGVNLSIVSLPDAKDPDELIRKDPKQWQKSLDSAKYVMDWLVEYHLEKVDINSAQGKKTYSDKLAELISRIGDPVEAEHYAQITADKTGVPLDRILQKVKTQKSAPKPRRKTPSQNKAAVESRTLNYVDTYIGLIALYPETRDSLSKLEVEQFIYPEQRQAVKEIKDQPSIKDKDLRAAKEYVKIATFRAEDYYGQSSSSARIADAMEIARRIADETKKLKTAELARRMKEAEDSADSSVTDKILNQVNQSLKED